MTATNNGGQAFPSHPSLYSSEDQAEAQGMTLRDYFAAKALPAVYVDAVREMNVYGFPDEHWRDGIAIDAYEMADAMIKAREP